MTMSRCALALTLLLAAAAPGNAQTGDHVAGPSGTSKAAGMALRDGALAPGMVTVRVVRGSFSNNLTGVPVVVEVRGGKTERGETDIDGRAHFAHLPIGGSARAFATVDGNRIESDTFEVPSESGLRLLLVVGDGPVEAIGMPAAPNGLSPIAPAPAAGSPQPEQVAPSATAPTQSNAVRAVQIAVIVATVLTFALVFGLRRSPSAK